MVMMMMVFRQITLYEDNINDKTTKQLAEVLENNQEILLLGLESSSKTSVVKALQSFGHVVAILSSQVNDIPSLVHANISQFFGVSTVVKLPF